MPVVKGKHYPYTAKGKKAAKKAMTDEEMVKRMKKMKMKMK